MATTQLALATLDRWRSRDATRPLLDRLPDGSDALADADAHRGQAVPRAAPPHLVQERCDQARAGCTQRMPDGDRAAVDVGLLRIEPQLPHAGDRLRGERLIELDQV